MLDQNFLNELISNLIMITVVLVSCCMLIRPGLMCKVIQKRSSDNSILLTLRQTAVRQFAANVLVVVKVTTTCHCT